MNQIIIHVDMDAFYAAVEVRDNPDLADKPLIIGALPHERGVVSTCSYEARKFGLRSAMSIKDAYRRCPQGIYMHPNIAKYKAVSAQIHTIWSAYTDIVEYLSLDEGYLDITGCVPSFVDAANIGREIKARTKSELGLTCSVGIGYSMMTAKLASEEKKPDGFFEIPSPKALLNLIIDRDVTVLYGIGQKTAEKLHRTGIYTVRDILQNQQSVCGMLGRHGQQIVALAKGHDGRQVTPHQESDAKSIGRECTFQHDITDFSYLKNVLLLLAKELSLKMRLTGLYAHTITLKVTYYDMKQITRSKSGDATDQTNDIYQIAAALLDLVDKRPIRLVGISLSNLTKEAFRQLSLADMGKLESESRKETLAGNLLTLQRKYGGNIIKTGMELEAEKRLKEDAKGLFRAEDTQW